MMSAPEKIKQWCRRWRLQLGVAVILLIVLSFTAMPTISRVWRNAGASRGLGVEDSHSDSWLSISKNRKSRKREVAGQQDPKFLSGPNYQLFTDNGTINPELLKLAGISVARADELQIIIDETWKSVGADLESRGTYVKEESDSSTGLRTYFVPADPQAAAEAREKFSNKLKSSFGEAAARIFTPYTTNEGFLAGFGAYDLKISLKPASSQGQPVMALRYRVTDPNTGENLSGGATSSRESYKTWFADAFLNQDPD